MESLEATALGWGELVGKREGRKLLQGDLEAMQVCLELQGSGRAGRIGSGSLAKALERRTQEQLAVGIVGHAKRFEEPERLARRQALAVDDGQAGGLVWLPQARQRVGERGADPAACEPVLGLLGELASQGQAPLDPDRPSPQEPGHLRGRVVVLVHERADHPGLVERCCGPRGGVGREQQPLVLGGREGRLHDDGHEAAALLAPAGESLEAVEDLVGSRLLGRRDPQGKVLQAVPREPAGARTQPGVAGPQLLDGKKAEARGGLLGTRDRRRGRARCARPEVLGRLELAGGRGLTTRNRARPCPSGRRSGLGQIPAPETNDTHGRSSSKRTSRVWMGAKRWARATRAAR